MVLISVQYENYLKKGGDPRLVVEKCDVIHTKVYGGFLLGSLTEQEKLMPDDMLTLLPDHDNKNNCFAIKVCSGKKDLGYLERYLSAAIMKIAEWECIVEEQFIQEKGSTQNIGVSVMLRKKQKL